MADLNASSNRQLHWLVRPATIRGLSAVSAVILLSMVALQLFVDVKGYFVWDQLFAFGAIFGFASCVGMVVVAKLLGVFLKRPDDYYDD